MTINVAWHWRGSVFFVADTAIRSKESPFMPVTSFGETVPRSGDFSIDQRAQKIRGLDQHTLASYSGNVFQANQFIDALSRKLRKRPYLEEAVHEVAEERRPERHAPFRLLIGGCNDKDGATFLLTWDSTAPTRLTAFPPLMGDIDPAQALAIMEGRLVPDGVDPESPPMDLEERARAINTIGFHGSAPARIQALMTGIVHLNSAGEADSPARILASTTAFLQGLGINEGLLEHGVGGAITAARVDAAGIHWMSSTEYFLFDDVSTIQSAGSHGSDLIEPEAWVAGLEKITVYSQNGFIAVASSFHPKTLIVLETGFETLDQERAHEAIREIESLNPDFVTFIQKARRNVVIVDRQRSRDDLYRLLGDKVLLHKRLVEALQFKYSPDEPGQFRTMR